MASFKDNTRGGRYSDEVIIGSRVYSVSKLRRQARSANMRLWAVIVIAVVVAMTVIPYMSMASVAIQDSSVFTGRVMPGYSMGGISLEAYGVDLNEWARPSSSIVPATNYGIWDSNYRDYAAGKISSLSSSIDEVAEANMGGTANIVYSRAWNMITGSSGYTNAQPNGGGASQSDNAQDSISPMRTVDDFEYWDAQVPSSATKQASISVSLYPDFVILAKDSNGYATLLTNPDDIQSVNATTQSIVIDSGGDVHGSTAIPYYISLSDLMDAFGVSDDEHTFDALIKAVAKDTTRDNRGVEHSPKLDAFVQNISSPDNLLYGTYYRNLNSGTTTGSSAFNPYPYSMVFSKPDGGSTVVSSLYGNDEAYVYFSPSSVYNAYVNLKVEYDIILAASNRSVTENDPVKTLQLGYYQAALAICEAYLSEALPQDMTRGYIGPRESNYITRNGNSQNAAIGTELSASDAFEGIGEGLQDPASYRNIQYATLMYDVANSLVKESVSGSAFNLAQTNALMDTLSTFGYASKNGSTTGVMQGMNRVDTYNRMNAFTAYTTDAAADSISSYAGAMDVLNNTKELEAKENVGVYVAPYYPIQQHILPDYESTYRFFITNDIPLSALKSYLTRYGFASNDTTLSYSSAKFTRTSADAADLENSYQRLYNMFQVNSGAETTEYRLAADTYSNADSPVLTPGSRSELTQNILTEENGDSVQARVDTALMNYEASQMTADNVHDMVDIVRSVGGMKFETFMRYYNPLKTSGGDTDIFLTRVSPARNSYVPDLLLAGYSAAGGLALQGVERTDVAQYDYFAIPSLAPCLAAHSADNNYYGSLNYELRALLQKGFISSLPQNLNIPAITAMDQVTEELDDLSETIYSNDEWNEAKKQIFLDAQKVAFMQTLKMTSTSVTSGTIRNYLKSAGFSDDEISENYMSIRGNSATFMFNGWEQGNLGGTLFTNTIKSEYLAETNIKALVKSGGSSGRTYIPNMPSEQESDQGWVSSDVLFSYLYIENLKSLVLGNGTYAWGTSFSDYAPTSCFDADSKGIKTDDIIDRVTKSLGKARQEYNATIAQENKLGGVDKSVKQEALRNMFAEMLETEPNTAEIDAAISTIISEMNELVASQTSKIDEFYSKIGSIKSKLPSQMQNAVAWADDQTSSGSQSTYEFDTDSAIYDFTNANNGGSSSSAVTSSQTLNLSTAQSKGVSYDADGNLVGSKGTASIFQSRAKKGVQDTTATYTGAPAAYTTNAIIGRVNMLINGSTATYTCPYYGLAASRMLSGTTKYVYMQSHKVDYDSILNGAYGTAAGTFSLPLGTAYASRQTVQNMQYATEAASQLSYAALQSANSLAVQTMAAGGGTRAAAMLSSENANVLSSISTGSAATQAGYAFGARSGASSFSQISMMRQGVFEEEEAEDTSVAAEYANAASLEHDGDINIVKANLNDYQAPNTANAQYGYTIRRSTGLGSMISNGWSNLFGEDEVQYDITAYVIVDGEYIAGTTKTIGLTNDDLNGTDTSKIKNQVNASLHTISGYSEVTLDSLPQNLTNSLDFARSEGGNAPSFWEDPARWGIHAYSDFSLGFLEAWSGLLNSSTNATAGVGQSGRYVYTALSHPTAAENEGILASFASGAYRGIYRVIQTFALGIVLISLLYIAFSNFIVFSTQYSQAQGDDKRLVQNMARLKVALPRTIFAVFMIGLPPAGTMQGFQGGGYLLLQIVDSIMSQVIAMFSGGNGIPLVTTTVDAFRTALASAYESGALIQGLFTAIGAFLAAVMFLIVAIFNIMINLILIALFLAAPIVWAMYLWPSQMDKMPSDAMGITTAIREQVLQTGGAALKAITGDRHGSAAGPGLVATFVGFELIHIVIVFVYWVIAALFGVTELSTTATPTGAVTNVPANAGTVGLIGAADTKIGAALFEGVLDGNTPIERIVLLLLNALVIGIVYLMVRGFMNRTADYLRTRTVGRAGMMARSILSRMKNGSEEQYGDQYVAEHSGEGSPLDKAIQAREKAQDALKQKQSMLKPTDTSDTSVPGMDNEDEDGSAEQTAPQDGLHLDEEETESSDAALAHLTDGLDNELEQAEQTAAQADGGHLDLAALDNLHVKATLEEPSVNAIAEKINEDAQDRDELAKLEAEAEEAEKNVKLEEEALRAAAKDSYRENLDQPFGGILGNALDQFGAEQSMERAIAAGNSIGTAMSAIPELGGIATEAGMLAVSDSVRNSELDKKKEDEIGKAGFSSEKEARKALKDADNELDAATNGLAERKQELADAKNGFNEAKHALEESKQEEKKALESARLAIKEHKLAQAKGEHEEELAKLQAQMEKLQNPSSESAQASTQAGQLQQMNQRQDRMAQRAMLESRIADEEKTIANIASHLGGKTLEDTSAALEGARSAYLTSQASKQTASAAVAQYRQSVGQAREAVSQASERVAQAQQQAERLQPMRTAIGNADASRIQTGTNIAGSAKAASSSTLGRPAVQVAQTAGRVLRTSKETGAEVIQGVMSTGQSIRDNGLRSTVAKGLKAAAEGAAHAAERGQQRVVEAGQQAKQRIMDYGTAEQKAARQHKTPGARAAAWDREAMQEAQQHAVLERKKKQYRNPKGGSAAAATAASGGDNRQQVQRQTSGGSGSSIGSDAPMTADDYIALFDRDPDRAYEIIERDSRNGSQEAMEAAQAAAEFIHQRQEANRV